MSKPPLHIAVFHNFPPCGGKRALYHHVKLLAQQGHLLDLYTLRSADETFLPLSPFIRQHIQEDIRPLKLLSARFPFLDQGRNVVRRLQHLKAVDRAHALLAKKINAQAYDLAFVQNCFFTHVPNILRYLKIPSVYYCAEPFRELHEPRVSITFDNDESVSFSNNTPSNTSFLRKTEGLWYALSESVYRKAYLRNELDNVRAATRLLTNSYYSRENIYKTYGIFPYVNYLGVDADHFCPKPEIPKEHLILSVSRIEPVKQHHIVIESVGRIPQQNRPRVVIVGEPKNQAYMEYLTRLAEKLSVLLRIEYSVSEEQLIAWYNRAKAVVFIPIMEPFGFISLEAMACGTPLIGVKEGGIREVILHEKTGLLVERDPHDISDAILRILQDEGFADMLSRSGREYVCTQWTWEKSCEQLLRHFHAVERRNSCL